MADYAFEEFNQGDGSELLIWHLGCILGSTYANSLIIRAKEDADGSER